MFGVVQKFSHRQRRDRSGKQYSFDGYEVKRANLLSSRRRKISVETFVELGVYNEWLGRTKLRFADVDLTTSDLSGPGFEASLGVNAKITDDAYLYGALTLETGKAYSSYLFNAGLRVKF